MCSFFPFLSNKPFSCLVSCRVCVGLWSPEGIPASSLSVAAAGDASQTDPAALCVQGGWRFELAFFGSQPQVTLEKDKTNPLEVNANSLTQCDLRGEIDRFEIAVKESGAFLKPGAVFINQAGTRTALGNLFRDGCKVWCRISLSSRLTF
jgi:hypothetical protein